MGKALVVVQEVEILGKQIQMYSTIESPLFSTRRSPDEDNY